MERATATIAMRTGQSLGQVNDIMAYARSLKESGRSARQIARLCQKRYICKFFALAGSVFVVTRVLLPRQVI